MAGATTMFKMHPADHEALKILLKYLAGKVTEDEFLTVLGTQGRPVAKFSAERVVPDLADYLINAVS